MRSSPTRITSDLRTYAPVSLSRFLTSINKCYVTDSNYYGILQDDNPSSTDLTPIPNFFFKSIDSYTNPDNWDSQHLWDFENVWAIDESYNDGLPFLKVFLDRADPSITVNIMTNPVDVSSVPNNTEVIVTLTSATSGVKIYYTLDGTMPTTASLEYNEPFTLGATSIDSHSRRIIAYAVIDGGTHSDFEYIDIQFEEASPEISVANSPDTPVTGTDSLILDVRSEASAVAGKIIEIWAMPKSFKNAAGCFPERDGRYS